MRKTIYLFSLLILASCSPNNAVVENHSNTHSEKKQNVLVVVNNNSNEIVSNQIMNEIISSKKMKNIGTNYVFHTSKQNGIDYDYKLELNIKEVKVYTNNEEPIVQTKKEYITNTYSFSDNKTTVVRNTSMPIESSTVIKKIRKNCEIKASLNLIDFKNGNVVYQKNIKKSTFHKAEIIENNKTNLVALQPFSNIKIVESSNNTPNFNKVEYPNSTSNLTNYVNKTENLNYSVNHDIINETLLKFKFDYIKFIDRI